MISDERLKFISEHSEGLTYRPCWHAYGNAVRCKECPYASCLLSGISCTTEAEKDIVDALKELQERRKKDKARKPIFKTSVSIVHCDKADGTAETRRTPQEYWHCPNCDGYVGDRVTVHGHVHDRDKKKFCEKCGQKIDWSEE